MFLLTSFYADTHESAHQTKTRHESAVAISRDAFITRVDESVLATLERHLGRPCTGFYTYENGCFTVSGGIDYVFNVAAGG